MKVATYALLVLSALTGLYVRLSESWTWAYRANLVLHPLLGVAATLVLVRYGRAHLEDKRGQRLVAARASGWLLALGWLAAFATGLVLVPGVAHAVRRLAWHRAATYGLAPVLVLHLARKAWLALRDRRHVERTWGEPGTRRWAVAWAGGIVAFLLAVGLDRPETDSVTIRFAAPLEGGAGVEGASAAVESLRMTGSCGQEVACHPELTRELERSNHARAPETPHFQKIAALLDDERGAGARGFCESCHAPALAAETAAGTPATRGVSGAGGFGCLVCHALAEAHLVDEPDHKAEGLTLAVNADHLALFPADGRSAPAPWESYLIRLNPEGHGRAMSPTLLSRDEACLACHQEHVRPSPETGFEGRRCVVCHMELQARFSESGSDRPHLFLGANVATPALLGDEELEGWMWTWLTGSFETRALDAFWDLRREGQSQLGRAVWLVLTVEPLGEARPGEELVLRVSTSNAGIGHRFPSGVLDLYDVWLEVRVHDAAGALLFRSGAPGGSFADDDGVRRLGGVELDGAGRPIERHRTWAKAGRRERSIEPGRTVHDDFAVKIPADARGPLTVRARWSYDRLNAPFRRWAYPDGSAEMPAVPVAEVEQRVPLAAGSAGATGRVAWASPRVSSGKGAASGPNIHAPTDGRMRR